MALGRCLVCWDDVPVAALVTSICSRTCPAAVCTRCLDEYILQQIQAIPTGAVAPLQCPACLRPVNLLQWTARCSSLQPRLETFGNHIRQCCDFTCPNCRCTTNVLPPHAASTTFVLPARYRAPLARLINLSRQFCRHNATAAQVWAALHSSFPQRIRKKIQHRLLASIQDIERRCTLFVHILLAGAPVVQSNCCRTLVCFTCKSAAHPSARPCRPVLESVRCPNCTVQVVKDDGCDRVRCFCGSKFSWTQELAAANCFGVHSKPRLSKLCVEPGDRVFP